MTPLQLFKKKKKPQAKPRKKGFTEKLFDIMKNHVGVQNGIKSNILFHEFYGNAPLNMNKYEAIFMWQKLQQAMNNIRKKTNMFIVFKDGVYFVATNHDEASQYRKRLQTTVKQTSALLERLDQSIDEKWYADLEYRHDAGAEDFTDGVE